MPNLHNREESLVNVLKEKYPIQILWAYYLASFCKHELANHSTGGNCFIMVLPQFPDIGSSLRHWEYPAHRLDGTPELLFQLLEPSIPRSLQCLLPIKLVEQEEVHQFCVGIGVPKLVDQAILIVEQIMVENKYFSRRYQHKYQVSLVYFYLLNLVFLTVHEQLKMLNAIFVCLR